MSEVASISYGHASIKRLRRLSRNRRDRQSDGAYVIEGATSLLDALGAGVEVLDVVTEPGLEESLERSLFAALEARGVVPRRAPVGALAKAVDTVSPQPVAAIAAMPSVDWRELMTPDAGFLLVLSGVSDPGNAGTLLRTAEATGARAVLFCDDSVDPYNPKCVRSSAGSLFRVPVATVGRAEDVLERAGDAGLTRMSTVARGGDAPDAVDLIAPFALVLGSEAHGLAPELAPHIDRSLTVPMVGRVESLNVAMAGTAIAFESLRQRRAAR